MPLERDPISAGPSAGLLDARDPSVERQRALEHWLDLQATLALRPERAVALLERAADPDAALRLHGSRVSRTAPEREARLSLLRRLGVRALPLPSPAYPVGLARLADAAPLLLLQGRADVSILRRACIAVVGARAATAYGLDLARELGATLARAGAVVVSGLARGIDAAAHRGALDAGGTTVAVQACGPDRIYPPEHRRLAAHIAETGLLLTEMPPGTPPRAPYFPLRNRLISVRCYEQLRCSSIYYAD